MIALSVSIEGAAGLTWPRWKEWVAAAERWGLAGLFVSDHLVGPFPPDPPSLDALAALVYAADRSERVHIGTMVSPLSIRDPVMLVRQALALDDLSGGGWSSASGRAGTSASTTCSATTSATCGRAWTASQRGWR